MAAIKTNSHAVTATAKGKGKAAPAAPLFAGRGMAARATALLQTAALAFATETSRAALIANMRAVLGESPTPAQVKAAKTQLVIGWVACRLPVNELPKGKTSPAERLTYAAQVVTAMARCPQEGKAAGNMGSKTARRSPVQERITRNAEKNASLFMGELNLSNAQTQKAKNAKQAVATVAKLSVAPSMAGSGKGKTSQPVTAPAPAELPAKANWTPDDVVAYLSQQSSMLQDFANKRAKEMPTDMGMAVVTFRKAIIAAANTYQVRKSTAARPADVLDDKPARKPRAAKA